MPVCPPDVPADLVAVSSLDCRILKLGCCTLPSKPVVSLSVSAIASAPRSLTNDMSRTNGVPSPAMATGHHTVSMPHRMFHNVSTVESGYDLK